MEQGATQEPVNPPFALQFLPVIVKVIKLQMPSPILLSVHPSNSVSFSHSFEEGPGEIRCPIDSKKFSFYSKLKVVSFNSMTTARLLVCVVQQVSLIKPVYSFLRFQNGSL